MSDETERYRQDNRSPVLHFEMVRRKPAAALAGIVTDICGYREMWPGHFRIVEYASLTCTHCARFHEDVWPELRKRFVDTGKVRFVLREFPLDPLSLAAFMLARAAGPDRREAYVDAFFKKQAQWAFNGRPLDTMPVLTAELGMKREEFDAVLKNEALLTSISQVRMRAQSQFGVNSTPTFFVDTERLVGARPISNFETAIAAQG